MAQASLDMWEDEDFKDVANMAGGVQLQEDVIAPPEDLVQITNKLFVKFNAAMDNFPRAAPDGRLPQGVALAGVALGVRC